jgi:hypothetical protein
MKWVHVGLFALGLTFAFGQEKPGFENPIPPEKLKELQEKGVPQKMPEKPVANYDGFFTVMYYGNDITPAQKEASKRLEEYYKVTGRQIDRVIVYPEGYMPVLIPADEYHNVKKQLGPSRIVPLVPDILTEPKK